MRMGLLALVLMIASGAPVALAATGDAASQRPVYLQVVTGSDDDSVLDEGLIEAMARETLSANGQPALSLTAGDRPPPGVRVLRIMVLTTRHHDATGTVLAASAYTSLFTTPPESGGVNALYYQGMQQALTTGSADMAAQSLRRRFKSALAQRIGDALSALQGAGR